VAGSFLILFGDDSSLFDLNLLDILSESGLDSLDNVGLVSLEGVEISAPSDFELGDSCALLDEDGYIDACVLFLVALALLFSLPLGSFSRARNSFAFVIYLG
jgi:hypothetical protein